MPVMKIPLIRADEVMDDGSVFSGEDNNSQRLIMGLFSKDESPDISSIKFKYFPAPKGHPDAKPSKAVAKKVAKKPVAKKKKKQPSSSR